MEEVLYEVRVTALAITRFPPPRIAAAFAEIVCLTVAEAESRLAQLPLSVRSNLRLEQAQKYCRVLGRAGMECVIVPQAGEGRGDMTEAVGQEA